MPESNNPIQPCPCGSNIPYDSCCRLLHSGPERAKTAEQLMRSRYSAYVLKQIDYLVQTTHPEFRSGNLKKEISDWAQQVNFFKLEIINTIRGGPEDKSGKVEFIAFYHDRNGMNRLHELSSFKKFKGKWLYLNGIIY